MLIINADDFGWTRAATDRALSCHARGRITSASAMVFMEDSERAASLALESGTDVGLHINFSERFSAQTVPGRLRECCERIGRFLKRGKYAPLFYHPGLRTEFRMLFEAQYEEFLRLYGRQPSHFDGHQHLHLASNMLAARILPRGARVRGSFSFAAGEKGLVNRLYRAGVNRCLARRHRITDYFFALPHPMSRPRLERIVDLARTASVELMTHPQRQNEFDLLMGEDFGHVISSVQRTGFDAL